MTEQNTSWPGRMRPAARRARGRPAPCRARHQRRLRWLTPAAVAAAALTVAACASSGPASYGAAGRPSHAAGSASSSGTLKTTTINGTAVLTNAEGFTLYTKGKTMRTLAGQRRRYVLAAAITAISVVACAGPGRQPGRGLPPLHPAAAPAGWRRAPLPNGTAVLSYPPSLHPVNGDAGTVSAARLGPGGVFQVYLNATPRQSSETLARWAAFRLRFLRADNAVSAHQDAAAQDVRFRGGTGSCIIDDYLTRIGAHHFQEIACLVQGRTGASVIVAAAPAARWVQARPLLFRAVAAYQVR